MSGDAPDTFDLIEQAMSEASGHAVAWVAAAEIVNPETGEVEFHAWRNGGTTWKAMGLSQALHINCVNAYQQTGRP